MDESSRQGPAVSFASARVLRRIPYRFVPLFAALAATVLVIFSRDRVRDRHLALRQGADVVALQALVIERELEAVAANALYFAEQGIVRDFLAGQRSRAEIEREYLYFCRVSGVYDQLRLIGPDGHEILRVNYRNGDPAAVPVPELQDKGDRYYFRLGWPLERQQIYLSPLDLNVEHEAIEEPWKPVMRLATPVFDETGAKRAILVFNYLGRSLLERLSAVAAQAPGWSGLVNPGGFYLEGPRPDLSWGFQFDREPTFAREHPAAWTAIRDPESGAFTTDEGFFTFRTVHPGGRFGVSSQEYPSELKVISFVPMDVAYAASWRTFRLLLWVGLAVAVLLIAAAWRLAYVGALSEELVGDPRRP